MPVQIALHPLLWYNYNNYNLIQHHKHSPICEYEKPLPGKIYKPLFLQSKQDYNHEFKAKDHVYYYQCKQKDERSPPK